MKQLHFINLGGVLALTVLCVAQWANDRRLNLEINRLERARQEQVSQLAEMESNRRGLEADLAHFKEQVGRSESVRNAERGRLEVSERALRQTASERDQLKASITDWVTAVAARDDRLKEGVSRERQLAGELTAAIGRFNELATNHNALVKELDECRARLAQRPGTGKPDPLPNPNPPSPPPTK